MDLSLLGIPPRIEFPLPYELIDTDRDIKFFEEVLEWLKENAPENTERIKRFEKRLAETKQMKEIQEMKNKIDRDIKFFEVTIERLKADTPKDTDTIKLFEGYLAELKELKSK